MFRKRFWTLETRADLERAIKVGAGVVAYCMLATLLMIGLGIFQPLAVLDAAVFAVLAWFMLHRSRVACAIAVPWYFMEQVDAFLDPAISDAHPNPIVPVFLLFLLVRAFVASKRYHALVTVPARALAADLARPDPVS
jgi:hypothetical protein